MEVEGATPVETKNKYLYVIPVIGLLLFYGGGLILSLEINPMFVFIGELVLFSAIKIVGLVQNRRMAVVIGALLLIVCSAGPVSLFLFSLSGGTFGLAEIGAGIMTFAIIFHILTMIIWYNS
ncbi:MAG: hypothetical protein ACP6KW_02735 [Candidatus Thorarchaeota archaeon]